jgi:hypothetical protein
MPSSACAIARPPGGERGGSPGSNSRIELTVSRRRCIAVASVLLVGVGGVFAWKHLPRDAPRPTSVDEALDAFRRRLDRAGGDSSRPPGFPQLGVYRYVTRGGESLDTAVVNAEHPYHGISTITVQPARCGVGERWQVLAARWSEGVICRTANGFRLGSVSEYREFFGIGHAVSDRCKGSVVPLFSSLDAGARWTTSCTSQGSTVSNVSRVVGVEPVEVAGRSLQALHVKSVVLIGGEDSGRIEQDDWRRRSDGLILKRTVSMDADFGIVGGGSYSESYTLELVSPRPIA